MHEFTPLLKSLEERLVPFISVNGKELYNQLCNNSRYMKLFLWISTLLILMLCLNYMFNFFSTFGISKNKRKKLSKRKNKPEVNETDLIDSHGEESKAYNPNPGEMFMTKAKQYEFQKKRLTAVELDSFVSELRNPGFLLNVIGSKDGQKQKILRLDKDGQLYWSKENAFELLSNIFSTDKNLLKSWPCTSINDVYLSEESLILELKGGMSIHLSTYPPLTAQRLVVAFKSLIAKLKKDPSFATNVFVDKSCKGIFTIESATKPDEIAVLRRIEDH